MTAVAIDKSDLKKSPGMPIYQCLVEHIIGRIRSGNLTPGDRLPTEHGLAKQLGLNRLTVRKSYQVLEAQNLVERCRGMGTFVSEVSRYPSPSEGGEKPIYFLIPHPVHIMLQGPGSVAERQIHYGALTENNGRLIQTIPVSKKLEDDLIHIDWDTVRQIPEHAQVFVNTLWFRNLIPFLLERSVDGICLHAQHEMIELPEICEQLAEAKWNFITLDRQSAMEQAIEYLYNLGRRRIAVIKQYRNEPHHPYRLGMISGCERCDMIYDSGLYHEVERNISPSELEKETVELWKRTKFDALIAGDGEFVKSVYAALTSTLRLRLPDDVALMSFRDTPSYLDFPVPITAIAFPYVNIGREIIKIFSRWKPVPEKSIFQASIIERESTRKGAGAYINRVFLPEIPINPNQIIN